MSKYIHKGIIKINTLSDMVLLLGVMLWLAAQICTKFVSDKVKALRNSNVTP